MRGGIVAVLALVVGVGVGYLLGVTREASPARAAPAAPPEPPPEIRPSGSTPLAQALRELPLPHAERGTGTISGRVARADGTPVEGTTVRASRRREDTWRERASGPPPPPDIEEEVRKFVAGLQWAQLNQAEAVTGADGRYAVSGLADGRYHMAAWRAGFRVRPGDGGWEAAPGATVDFTAEPVVEVEFEVLLPDGSAPSDASVRLKSGNRSSGYGWRPGQPVILVEPGSFSCTASTRDDLYKSPEVRLDLVEGAPAPPTVVLRLEGRPGITGTVAFAPDVPFEHYSVHALSFTGEKPPDSNELLDQGKSDGRGRAKWYQILDLAPGRYLVGVTLQRSVVTTRIVDVLDRLVTCDFAIDSIDPSLVIVVRVLDPSGNPVKDVNFGTSYKTERSSHSGGSDKARRPDGSFLVFHQPHDRAEGGTYFVKAISEQYGEKEAAYKKGDAEVVIRFSEPATLDVLIAGFQGSEHGTSITVGFGAAAGDENARFGSAVHSKKPDGEGRVSFGPFENGEYRLLLYAGGGSWSERITVAKHAVTLAPGKNAVTIPLPRLYALVVSDPEGKQGHVLTLAPEAGDSWSRIRASLGEHLSARFASLPEGAYQLRRDGGSSGAMRVTVRSDATITFRPVPHTAMRVRIADPSCAAAKAGLMDGDLIVAVDGDELESEDELQLAHASLRVKEKASLGILRAAGRVEVRVSAKELFAAGAGGAQIEWAAR